MHFTAARHTHNLTESLMVDICAWDVATWSQAVRFWNQRPLSGRCLELGARKGGLSLWLALKGCDVLCSDMRRAEERASALHRRYGVSVTYENIDALSIPYENHFDIIVFKSMLGALQTPERQFTAIQQMRRALKFGGVLLFAENLTASALHRAARRRFRPYTEPWRYVTASELREMLRSFTSVELRTAGVLAAFGTTEHQRTALARLDQMSRNLWPAKWRYIGFGIATK